MQSNEKNRKKTEQNTENDRKNDDKKSKILFNIILYIFLISLSLSLRLSLTFVSRSIRTKVDNPNSSDVSCITPVQDRIIVTKAFFAHGHFATKTDGSESKSVNGDN